MQFPNPSQSTQSSFYLPQPSQIFPNIPNASPWLQAFSSLNPFFNFPSPHNQEVMQARIYQSMFERFLQAQIPKPFPAVNNMSSMLNSEPMLNTLFSSYLNLFKTQIASKPTGQISSLDPFETNLKNQGPIQEPTQDKKFLIKKEFFQKEEDSPQNEEEKTGLSSEESIKEMLLCFVKHIGMTRRNLLEKEGEKIHHNNENLKEVFMGLMKKFLSSRKTKEEKIKYVLRKCFKFMKDKLLEENGFTFDSTDDYVEKLNSDKVDKMFFKHYFSEKCGKAKKFLTKNEITFIKDISMPFRKNSQNKTMNIEFLRWIFSNEQFYLDYKLFLKSFNEVTHQDNVEKIDKTAKKIFELMETKNYKGFSQKYFKRMPWLDIWRIEAKEIALSLMELYSKCDEKIEFMDSEEISLELIEPKPIKKVKSQESEEALQI